MESDDVIAAIKQILPSAEIHLEGADCNYTALVISEAFTGKSPLQRELQILGCFREELTSGTLHALTVRTFTPAEWAGRGQHLVQLSL